VHEEPALGVAEDLDALVREERGVAGEGDARAVEVDVGDEAGLGVGPVARICATR
jgi:hypothetical protein